jgi:uncharacterized membrane protein
MTASIANSHWPASTPSVACSMAWRFARVLPTPGGAALQWVLRRNCSMSPRQMLAVFLSLSALMLLIAGFFWWHGATLVLPFAGIEILALGVALVVHARHVGDRETLTLQDGLLQVEHWRGRRVERMAFRALWVRVEPQHGDDSLVELSGQGQRMHVGRYLQRTARSALAQELRRALRSGLGAGLDSLKDSDRN